MMVPTECQRLNVIGTHTLAQRLRGRLDEGLGIKSGVRRLLRPPRPVDPLGAPSSFRTGQWVRVLDEERVRATLDAGLRLRGLKFVPEQFTFCGGVYRVEHVVRRIVDDHGRFRPVGRTVLLEGVDCGGPKGTAGCGRHCPLMFRDEWLEPAEAPDRPAARERPDLGHVRVRPLEAIRATLDWRGRRDGLAFMPEMAEWAGKRLRVVRQLDSVYEYDRYTYPPRPIYVLEGPQCAGTSYGARGPCDRRCAILWHADWVEPAA